MPEAAPPVIPPRQVEDVDQTGAGDFRIGRLSLFVLIVLTMLPLPLLAALACWSMGTLERWDESLLLFMGFLTIPIVLIEATLDPSDATLFVLGLIMWLGLALPGVFMARFIRRRSHLLAMLGAMAAISGVQATLGAFMLWGKSV
ncbi:MAG: hypothetical protein MK085_07935 [Phycisphaerales bacterium]|nr:hypothetical protein [Phycisphaerales bacterium]